MSRLPLAAAKRFCIFPSSANNAPHSWLPASARSPLLRPKVVLALLFLQLCTSGPSLTLPWLPGYETSPLPLPVATRSCPRSHLWSFTQCYFWIEHGLSGTPKTIESVQTSSTCLEPLNVCSVGREPELMLLCHLLCWATNAPDLCHPEALTSTVLIVCSFYSLKLGLLRLCPSWRWRRVRGKRLLATCIR